MPLATRRDQFGRPVYADPTKEGMPDDPLALIDEVKQQQQSQDPPVDLPAPERTSSIDYSSFNRRQQVINAQGVNATARAQQAAVEAMQRRLQRITDQRANYAPPVQNNGGGSGTTDLRSKLVSTVASYKGTPYEWGGADPSGFDCSGLVYYAYSRLGISMPRTSAQQAHKGVRMPINKLQPGDLVANPGHIAVYAGNGMMWESPHTGASVRLVPVRRNMYGVHLYIKGDSRG